MPTCDVWDTRNRCSPAACLLLLSFFLAAQNTSSPATDWDLKLKYLLPWLADNSPTLSLVYRNCSIQQALNVAYSRHDAISGEACTAC